MTVYLFSKMDNFSSSSVTLKAVDIVGLSKADCERTCDRHEVCGRSVQLEDVLILKKIVLEFEGKREAAVEARKLQNGQISCRVGFVARNMAKLIYNDTLVKVVTLYECSESAQDRRRSHRNNGMLLAAILSHHQFNNNQSRH